MRKIVLAVAALALLGGTAGAATGVVETHRLNRWGFGGAGTKEAAVVYSYCPPGQLITSNRRRTAGDWLTGILTAGIYTPEHVTMQCSMR